MRKSLILLVAAALVATLVTPVLAGEGHKCTASTQDCLNHMAQEFKNRGWLGIEGEKSDTGFEITEIIANSPAEESGLRVGDILTAMNVGIMGPEEVREELELTRHG